MIDTTMSLEEILAAVDLQDMIMLIAAAVILIWRVCTGFCRGLVRELSGVISLAAAIGLAGYLTGLLCGRFLPGLSAWLPVGLLTETDRGHRVVYVLVLIVLYRILHGLTSGLQLWRRLPVIGFADGLLGALAGIAEAALMIAAVEIVMGYSAAWMYLLIYQMLRERMMS